MSSMPATNGLSALTDHTGRFAMLALDQRESLRTMMAAASGGAVTDEALVDFKARGTEALSPYVTGVLLDRLYGLPAARARHANCALILAADVLHQEPGGPVTGASLDEEVTPELVHEVGATALKMLVPWLPQEREQAIDLAGRFMELCRAAKVPGIVEGVVRPADIAQWSDTARDDALVSAAEDLATVRPDLYKAEVPSYGRADAAAMTEVASRISGVLDCPWVVLSSGVAAADFPKAVAACRAGGADGFLAGRAVWADAVGAADLDEFFATESVRRLRVMTSGPEAAS